MTANHIINWTLAATLAALLSTAYLLDGPDDHSTEWRQAQDIETAQKTAQAAARFDKAARAMCGGENAAWSDLGNGTIQCSTKRGHRTVRVAAAEVRP